MPNLPLRLFTAPPRKETKCKQNRLIQFNVKRALIPSMTRANSAAFAPYTYSISYSLKRCPTTLPSVDIRYPIKTNARRFPQTPTMTFTRTEIDHHPKKISTVHAIQQPRTGSITSMEKLRLHRSLYRIFVVFSHRTQNIEQHGRTRRIRHECGGCTYTQSS